MPASAPPCWSSSRMKTRWRSSAGRSLWIPAATKPIAVCATGCTRRSASMRPSTNAAWYPKDPAPYYHLALALDEQAKSAGSEASRIDLLVEACRLLTEGLRQAPDEPNLRQELSAITPKLPESAGCAPGP